MGEVPVTGSEGEEGSHNEGELRSQEVTKDTTCFGAGLNSPPSPPTLLCNSPIEAIRLAVKRGDWVGRCFKVEQRPG